MCTRILLLGLLLTLAGCATSEVNPKVPRAKTGYVDFYVESEDPISWEVSEFAPKRKDYKSVFSDIEPSPDRVLRLAFTPGHKKLRVAIINRVTKGPVPFEADVHDGLITPVRVSFAAAGSTRVKDRDILMGAKIKGRRGIKVTYDVSVVYQVSVEPDTPKPYLVKEQMPYWR